MRLVKVTAPEGKGDAIAQIAFKAGISEVAVQQTHVWKSDGRKEVKDAVDLKTATPKAKAFLDEVMAAPFFDPKEYSIDVRQPFSIASR